ncbi:stage III sporulation protein AA [Serpentinicella sp. ANB-PHB4]|uniref:stage III sporulation protein AA n=1 Tax=Serpentinicella sp. ANB-PHB4 TaxID=3074076 RepID=UPI002859996B|nr:stage III sporulation protein AA [Serpentinicella sp. ANB-PHB4]MDR5658200.1 stage III sporulation protein AA [Serpentinicella sp. ANB-PHB4]
MMNQMQPNYFHQIEMFLCPEIRALVSKLPKDILNAIEEVRLRVHRPLMIYCNGKDHFIDVNGKTKESANASYIVTKKNIENTLQFITNYSIYSVEEEMKNGYITVQGGHRVGIVGKVLLSKNEIKSMKEFSGLNIRISKEKKGIASSILKYMVNDKKEFINTIIVSPPQCGKTTLLRDIIRNFSEGVPELGISGQKIGVVDERSEIAACFQGVPQNDLGPRVDVLDACPKAIGMMMLVRAMSPNIIATDEIGRGEDINAIEEALLAGIKLITTVHGKTLDDILQRMYIGDLIKRGVFERVVVLSNSKGVGTIEKVLDGITLKELTKASIKNKVG